MRVLGIDPSLTSTGLAIIDTRDRLVIDTWTVTTKPTGDDIDARLKRLQSIIGSVACLKFDGAVIETPSLGQARQGGTLDRAGLYWLLTARLADWLMPTVHVTPAQRAKYATGNGGAGKASVILAAARRYPLVDLRGDDEVDALILAAIGARLAGEPIEDSLPAAHLAALDKIALPEGWPT